jgi:hypothetical protein
VAFRQRSMSTVAASGLVLMEVQTAAAAVHIDGPYTRR